MEVELIGLVEKPIQFSTSSVLQSRLSDEMLVRLQEDLPRDRETAGFDGQAT